MNRFVLAILALLPAAALAYPSMVRHGYATCSQCHADPSGAGLLTPYGRAQSELLLRSQYRARSEEEEPGPAKDFLFGAVTLPAELQLGGSLRTMGIWRPASRAVRAFPMQADLFAQLEGGRLRANASLGYARGAARPASLTTGTGDALISRHHWLGVSLGDGEWMLRAGRMNLPFGLRTVEHPLWVRQTTRTDLNEGQQHGVAVAFGSQRWRGELMGTIGNLQLSPDVFRERGYSAFIEHSFSNQATLGASSLVMHARRDLAMPRPVWRHAHGLFARMTVHPMVVLLAEADYTLLSHRGLRNAHGLAGMLQADFEPAQGLHFIATGELFTGSMAVDPLSFGGWAGVAWFFAPHADVRVDGMLRSIANPTTSRSQLDSALMLQLHLSL